MANSFYTTMALHEIDAELSASSCCVASSDVSDYVSKLVRLETGYEFINLKRIEGNPRTKRSNIWRYADILWMGSI